MPKKTSRTPADAPTSPRPGTPADSEAIATSGTESDSKQWPIVKLTLQPDILEAIKNDAGEHESVQHAIIRILAAHFKLTPIIRQRGQRSRPPTGSE